MVGLNRVLENENRIMSKVLKSAIPKISSQGKQPFTVFIEGNIGAGKTTFLNHFRKYDDVLLHTEPVEKWRNVNGFNLLVSGNLLVSEKNVKKMCSLPQCVTL